MPSLITKRDRKRYCANVMVHGLRRTRLFSDDTTLSYKLALEWENEAKNRLLTGVNDLTVSSWISQYMEDVFKRVQVKTYCGKKSVLNRFLQATSEDLLIEKISKSHIIKYIKGQKHRSGAAINEDIKQIKTAWHWGQKNISLFPKPLNPFQSIKKYPVEHHDRYVPPAKDFWKVYSVAVCEQDRAMLLTLFYTAARPIEVFRLKFPDLDFDSSKIRLWTRKGTNHDLTSRWAPMVPELQAGLKTWLSVRDRLSIKNKTHVFISLHFRNCGCPFEERRYFMRQLCKKAGVTPFGMYGIRHLRARLEYASCHNLNDLQRLLGHKKPSTTDKYLKDYGLDIIHDGLEYPEGS